MVKQPPNDVNWLHQGEGHKLATEARSQWETATTRLLCQHAHLASSSDAQAGSHILRMSKVANCLTDGQNCLVVNRAVFLLYWSSRTTLASESIWCLEAYSRTTTVLLQLFYFPPQGWILEWIKLTISCARSWSLVRSWYSILPDCDLSWSLSSR